MKTKEGVVTNRMDEVCLRPDTTREVELGEINTLVGKLYICKRELNKREWRHIPDGWAGRWERRACRWESLKARMRGVSGQWSECAGQVRLLTGCSGPVHWGSGCSRKTGKWRRVRWGWGGEGTSCEPRVHHIPPTRCLTAHLSHASTDAVLEAMLRRVVYPGAPPPA